MRCLTGGAIPAEIAKLEGKNAAGATIGFVNGEFLTGGRVCRPFYAQVQIRLVGCLVSWCFELSQVQYAVTKIVVFSEKLEYFCFFSVSFCSQ